MVKPVSVSAGTNPELASTGSKRCIYANNAGVRLHAVARGDSQRPAVVLVHGYPDNHQVWDAVAEQLAQDFHVIAYDVRGAGQSDRPARVADYDIALLSADLQAVVDTTIPGRSFHLVGHDWGSVQGWESVTAGNIRQRILSFTSLSGPCLDHVGFWMRDHLFGGNLQKFGQAARQLASSWYIMMFHLPLLAPALWRYRLGKHWPQVLAASEGIADVHPNPTQTQDGENGIMLYRANFLRKVMQPEQRRAQCPVQLIVPLRDGYVGAQLFSDLQQWVDVLYRREIDATHWVLLSHPARIAGWIGEFVHAVEKDEETAALVRVRIKA